ncbi:hypothetical protein Bca101_020472 [Brassica carinata]
MKIHIYASCGLWKSSINNGWEFVVDEEIGGRLLTLDTSSTFDNLKVMVCEDFGIDVNVVNMELSYVPSDLINSIDSPPVIITNDRQVMNFLTYVKKKASTRLSVSIQSKLEESNSRDDFDLNEEATESPNREEEPMEYDDSDDMDSEEDVEVHDSDDDKKCDKEKSNGNGIFNFLVNSRLMLCHPFNLIKQSLVDPLKKMIFFLSLF